MKILASCTVALAVLTASGGAGAYVRSVVPETDVCLYWEDRVIAWSAAQPLGSQAPEAEALAALRTSFRTWEGPSCTDLQLPEGERAPRRVGYSQSGANENVVLFRSEGSCDRYAGEPCDDEGTCPDEYDCWLYDPNLLAVTTTTFDRCGRILDADIEFNGGLFRFTTVSSGPGVAFDVQNTATHEIGHLLGLDHPPRERDATMFASAEEGEVKKRDLSSDDVDGICAIYPEGEPAAACVEPGECLAGGDGESSGCGGTSEGSGSGCSALPGAPMGAALGVLLLLALRRRARG